jgi:hypothetical protein
MNCPQCSAEVPESAIYCPRCGSAVRSVSFSYLPAGAPPWPTTIPQSAYYMSGSALQTSQNVPQKTEDVAGEGIAKRRWIARGALLVALLFILTPLVGVGITLGVLAANGEFPAKTIVSANTPVQLQQTPGTGTPQTNPGSGSLQAMSSTASTKLGVSMQFPSDWVEDASHMSVDSPYVIFRPQSQNGIVFVIQRFSISTSAQISSASDLNQAIIQANFQDPSVAQHVHNFHTLPPTQAQRNIGGAQWDEQDAAFTNDFGILIHVTSIAVQHSQVYFDIVFTLPDTSYSSMVDKNIQPMLNSFQFLS